MGGRDRSETCDVCGFERGGLNDLECDCDYAEERRSLELRSCLQTLIANLVIAGALCRSYEIGEHNAIVCTVHVEYADGPGSWWLGCGWDSARIGRAA